MTKTNNKYLVNAVDYLKLPYMRSVVPQSDGSFHAEILEFPGCIAAGDSMAEAYELLEEVAVSWVEASIEVGRAIPEPLETNDFSGKTVLRMPRSLHRQAAIAAHREGVSLNQFIVTAIGVALGKAAEANDRPGKHVVNVYFPFGTSLQAIESQSTGHAIRPQIFEAGGVLLNA